MEFHNQVFILLIIPAIAAVLIAYRMRTRGRLRFSHITNLRALAPSNGLKRARLVRLIRILALLLLVIAFAGPRLGVSDTRKFRYGADVMVVADVSTSMSQDDYKDGADFISRLDGSRKVLLQFLFQRKNNRVGIITFAKDARTLCPLTLDYEMLREVAKDIEIVKTEEEDGTAIGMAIANAINRLRKSRVPSKAIILLTDGMNNWGWLSPMNAAQLARSENIAIFTVGTASFEMNFDSTIDSDLLREISSITGGRYFRAKDVRSLSNVYATIDEMKPTDMPDPGYGKYLELAPIFIMAALGLYFIEMILKNTIFMTIP